MVAKLLVFIVNLTLACALVVLSTYPSVRAQDGDDVEPEQQNVEPEQTVEPEQNVEPEQTVEPEQQGVESVQVTIKLTGTAVIQTVGDLSVSPATFDTGIVDIGESVAQTITLTHTGASDSEPVAINAVELSGVSTQEFSIDYAGYTTLQPGDSQNLIITFSPVTEGEKNAGIRLDIQGSSAPRVIMIRGSAKFPLTSRLQASKAMLAFGEVEVTEPASQSVTVTNDSTDDAAPPVNLLAVSITGDTAADFSHDFVPKTLAPGESTSIEIKMQSAQEGHKVALITIEHDGVNNAVAVELEGDVVEPAAIPVNFSESSLNGTSIDRGTALQFGPDGRLYVTQMRGQILVYKVQRDGKNDYSATLDESINNINTIVNHDDDGDVNNAYKNRLLTGLYVGGTAATPVIYTQSSDPRFGAGPSGTDTNLDTNSGILHRLTKNGNNWSKVDLVRGLPRSEENHQGNGMVMLNGKLLAAQGGNTNMGGPSNNFAEITEYALSAAILEFDLDALGNNTYDLPTLDDEDRPGTTDNNDPFGGNNGQNQAILEANGPVKIYAPGFRNAYDLVLTEAGKLYTVDNGPNAGWGGEPLGDCSNDISENGLTYGDTLHHITNRGYYGGHPNPTRGSKNNKFNAENPQSPIAGNANPLECQYKIPLLQDGALTIFTSSTNGLAEYTADNFGKAMQGDLIMASFGKKIFRVQLNGNGTKVTSKSELKTNVGSVPLDVIAQGSNDPFPGTIWIVDNAVNKITVLEPADY